MRSRKKNTQSFDPRAKIVLMVLTVLAATQAPTLSFVWGLMVLIALLAVLCGKVRGAMITMLVFGLFCGIRTLAMQMKPGGAQTMIFAWMSLMFQVYPCGFMAGIILSTTRINEFLTAMTKLHISNKITIPMAVMLRYLPTIREDWHFIKDAMRQRGIAPNLWGLLTKPALTVECVYTPLLISASRAADELTVAAVTRGVEAPNRRSCLVKVQLRLQDYGIIFIFAAYYMVMIFGGSL